LYFFAIFRLKETKSAGVLIRLLTKSFIILIGIMEREYAEYLLKKTKADYNLIAEDFARTRSYLPDDINLLSVYTEDGDKVLDLGCGNGRLVELFKKKNIEYVGADVSERLIKIAKNKYPQTKFIILPALSLPFPENFFDKIYSLAVFHHIPSREFRLSFLKEARRVLKPGGLLILRVWDFWQRKAAPRLLLKYAFLKLIAWSGGKASSKLDFKDVFIPWKNSKGQVLTQRYFHCFTKSELEKLVEKSGFKIKKSWRAGRDSRTNIYLIAEK
jgi:alkylated DNA repair protein alkB family protein 8